MSLEAGFGGHSRPGLCWSSLMPLLSEQLRCAATTLPDRCRERRDCLALWPKTALPPVLRQLWDREWGEPKGFSVLESGWGLRDVLELQ